MKLYTAPGSCSSASHIALLEGQAEFEVQELNLRSDRKLPDGRLLSHINPKDYVPVLELNDGSILTENVAVLLYIADHFPSTGRTGVLDTWERYRLLEWLAFINSEVHKTCSHFFNPNLPEDMRPILTMRLNTRYRYIDTELAERNFLTGDEFTVVDSYLYVVSSWAPKLDYDLASYANVRAWQQRISERDSVKKVLGAG